MKPIKIITDSCADVNVEMRGKHDIESIDFTVYYGGKEVVADPWRKLSPKELYETLRSGERVYTLPATEHEIRTKLKKYADTHDILYIAACEKQSTTIVKAKRIAKELMEDEPERKIIIIDSLNASVGQGMLVLKACDLRDEGLAIDEIAEKISSLRKRVVQFATVETLSYLSKANKINARSAMFGDLLDIKPILVSDADGRQTSMKSIRGREKSISEVIRLFMENVEDPEDQIIYIIHGYDLKTAVAVEGELERLGFKCKKLKITCVGPVVGVSTGPGMIGLFGFGKEVTFRGE